MLGKVGLGDGDGETYFLPNGKVNNQKLKKKQSYKNFNKSINLSKKSSSTFIAINQICNKLNILYQIICCSISYILETIFVNVYIESRRKGISNTQ